MRALRDSLIAGGLLAGTCLLCGSSIAASVVNPYFPLAVGNSWTYRCSIDGDVRLEKTLRIVSMREEGGQRVFPAELRVKGDPKPLLQAFTLASDGAVFKSLGSNHDDRELLITADPRVGDRIATWIVGSMGVTLDAPARKNMQAVRVENFSIEDAAGTNRRLEEWRGRFYVRGIGPSGEADGLGGECSLLRFNVR